jgi:hypothetical protein
MTVYEVTDRLHDGRSVRVHEEQLADTVTAWLAELGASSPSVGQLARAARAGDWPVAHQLADFLGVEVTVTA